MSGLGAQETGGYLVLEVGLREGCYPGLQEDLVAGLFVIDHDRHRSYDKGLPVPVPRRPIRGIRRRINIFAMFDHSLHSAA